MTSSNIHIELGSEVRMYDPGELLTGRFFVENPQQEVVRAAELSVLWYTAGKGEEDIAVHFFERYGPEGSSRLDLRTPRSFHVELPRSPLSYDGAIVKVCWCVRVRTFLPRGQEVVAEVPFRLGTTTAAANLQHAGQSTA